MFFFKAFIEAKDILPIVLTGEEDFARHEAVDVTGAFNGVMRSGGLVADRLMMIRESGDGETGTKSLRNPGTG